MLKRILVIGLAFVVLNLGCQSVPGEVLTDVKTTPTVIAGRQDEEAYKVRVEIVLSYADVQAYPELFQAYVGALQEWANVLPVEFIVMVPEEGSTVTTSDIRRERRGVVMVNFTHNIPSKEDQNNLGIWFPKVRVMNLDLDDMYIGGIFNASLARAVSLHELGHMFGLPHIGNTGELNIQVGDLTVNHGAEFMMMHPQIPGKTENVVISRMEAEYAKRYLLTVFSYDAQNF